MFIYNVSQSDRSQGREVQKFFCFLSVLSSVSGVSDRPDGRRYLQNGVKRHTMNFFQKLFSMFSSDASRNVRTEAFESEMISKKLFFDYLDAQRAVILFFSPQQGWVGGNLAFYDTFGFENMEVFRSRYQRITDFFVDENYVVFADDDEAWLKQLVGSETYPRVRVTLPAGRPAVFELRSSAFKSGKNGLYFLEMSDVTLEERSKQEIEQVEASKRKFLNNISHEFRTPMNGILGFLDLLKQSHPNAKQNEYIEMVDRSATHMMSTIETLLDLAQMQSGKLRLAPSEFSPIREFERVLDPYFDEALQHGIALEFFLDPKLPAYITADFRKLWQVLSQLLDNALKFTEAGGKVHVEIRILKVDAHQRYTLGFMVKDTGIGIDGKLLKRITEPFESGEHPDQRLGIGLSLTEGLLQMMKAELRVASQKGEGSQFSFDIDVQGTAEPALTLFAGKRAKVVLFDDMLASDANLLSRYLQGFGLTVSKVHHSESVVCGETDAMYLVTTSENSGWMMQLGSVTNGCAIVMLMQEQRPLPHGASHIVDYTLQKPMLPTATAKHLARIFKSAEQKTAPASVPNEKIKALIVEDNRINQRLIKLLLEQYNISVATADNGSEAVELCRKYPYDIIFMDIDMPVKDGISATHEIRGLSLFQTHACPIIALTALAMQGDRERILAEGLDDYVSKPLGREKLELILTRHLKALAHP